MSETNIDKKEKTITSSRQLGNYITVASPGAWLVMITALVLLLGIIVWSAFGEIESRKKTVIISDEKGIRCFIKAEDIDEIRIGQKVTTSEGKLSVAEISSDPIAVDEHMSEYVCWVGEMTPGEYVYPVYLTGSLIRGVYNAEISIATLTPIALLYD